MKIDVEFLQKRSDGRYRYRRVVPKELQPLVGKKNILVALGRDEGKALKLYPKANAEAERLLKAAAKALAFHDLMALHQLIMTTAFATAGYIMQMKLQAMGRSDSEEFLQDRLSPKNLAAAAFSRAGMSSIIPMLVDTGLLAAGQDPAFSFARTTGQASNMWLGNPTTGGIEDTLKATQALAGLADDREWSQQEARNLLRVLPFGNAIPIVMVLSGLVADQPQRPPRY